MLSFPVASSTVMLWCDGDDTFIIILFSTSLTPSANLTSAVGIYMFPVYDWYTYFGKILCVLSFKTISFSLTWPSTVYTAEYVFASSPKPSVYVYVIEYLPILSTVNLPLSISTSSPIGLVTLMFEPVSVVSVEPNTNFAVGIINVEPINAVVFEPSTFSTL